MTDLAKTESKNFAFRKATSPQAFYLQAVMAISRQFEKPSPDGRGEREGVALGRHSLTAFWLAGKQMESLFHKQITTSPDP